MSDQTDHFALNLLQAIRTDIGELKANVMEVKERLGLLVAQYSSVSRRVDRLVGDVERIKRRFDIADAPAT